MLEVDVHVGDDDDEGELRRHPRRRPHVVDGLPSPSEEDKFDLHGRDADLGRYRAAGVAVQLALLALGKGGRIADQARRQFDRHVLDVFGRQDGAAFRVDRRLTLKLLVSSKGRAPAPVEGVASWFKPAASNSRTSMSPACAPRRRRRGT